MSRLSALAATLVASFVVASPAAAIDPPTPPTPASTTLPGTTRVADAWKLVGRGNPSAVQVAPRWVIGSGHGPMEVGSTFTNAYGSAVVQSTVKPPCDRDCGGTDLSLSLLATPLAGPTTFPRLLGEGIAGNTSALPGSVLSAGFGKVETGTTASVGWARPDGGPVAGQSVAPGTWYGDSGGASFWYPTATGEPVLASILINLGDLSLGFQQNLSDDNAGTNLTARQWLESQFALTPAATAPQFVDAATAIDPANATRPTAASGVYLATGGASTVKIAWTNPTGGPTRTGYKILLNGTLKTTVAAGATSVKLTGLSWLTNYTARVVATGPGGDAAPSPTLADTVAFKTRWLF